MIFVRSFLIAGIISLAFGYSLSKFFGFWEATVLAFVIQFVIAFVYSSFKISKNTTLSAEFENELEQLLALSETSIPCPCGNFVYTDNIFVSLEHGYTCEKCNNEFRIDISLTPTLLTTPLNVGYDFDKNTEAEAEAEDVSITQEYTKGTEL
jgi:hypothetical protein